MDYSYTSTCSVCDSEQPKNLFNYVGATFAGHDLSDVCSDCVVGYIEEIKTTDEYKLHAFKMQKKEDAKRKRAENKKKKREKNKELKKQGKSKKKPKPKKFNYQDKKWLDLRYQALKKYGAKCSCCGATPESGAIMQVDHIKPKSKYPELTWDIDNLQILCQSCNLGKSNVDDTQWR